MVDHLIKPHGGKLIKRIVGNGRREELRQASLDWPSWDLTPRQICDLELILNGAFSPLEGFLTRKDYEPVCHDMRLGLVVEHPDVLDLERRQHHALLVAQG